jgi:hypothetical protein
MKELIKKILREEVQRRFTKSNQNFERIIIKHMENVISETTRIVPPPEENYGNYGEEWCKGGNAILEVRYYLFSEDEDDVEKFVGGSLFVIFKTNLLKGINIANKASPSKKFII